MLQAATESRLAVTANKTRPAVITPWQYQTAADDEPRMPWGLCAITDLNDRYLDLLLKLGLHRNSRA